MPALTATSALVGAAVLLGVWSGRRWGRRRKRVLDAEARRFHTRRDRQLLSPWTYCPPAPTAGGYIVPPPPGVHQEPANARMPRQGNASGTTGG